MGQRAYTAFIDNETVCQNLGLETIMTTTSEKLGEGLRKLHAGKKWEMKRQECASQGKHVVIYCDDCAFLALDTLSTASLIGPRPFKTVMCALR